MNNRNIVTRIEIPGFSVLDQWLTNHKAGKRIDRFFVDNNYKRIAIYGFGRLSVHVLEELKNSDIEIVYGIDRNPDSCFVGGIKIIRPEDILTVEPVDAIVITPLQFFNEIELDLIGYGYKKDIISLAQVVDYVGWM